MKPILILALIIVLALAAVALPIVDAGAQQRQAARSEEFQRLVGGLGFGPALDLLRCPCSFDPRLEDSCAEDDGPLPGGTRFCPQHAGSVFYYPPLERSGSAAATGE